MVLYDHPVYRNGKLVLWHGAGKDDPADKANETDPAASDGAANDAKPKAKPSPVAKAEVDDSKPKPDAEFIVSVDIDDPCSAHMAGDVVAAVKAAGLHAHVTSGKVSAKALAKLNTGESVDFAVAPLDALTEGDAAAWKDKTPYVARFANETIEVIAAKSVASLRDLDGKLIAVGLPDSAGEVVATTLFARLGIKPRAINDNLADGLDELVRGRVEAVVAIGAGASKALARFNKGDRYHLVPLPMTAALAGHYSPVKLASAARPQLIESGANVDTLAATMALVAVNAAPGSPRADRDASFVNSLFDQMATKIAPGADPAWRDVNLAATLDWPRLAAADDWLGQRNKTADPAFKSFRALARAGTTDADKLFQSLIEARGAQP